MTENAQPAEVFPPGEYLRDELDARGWSEVEFAQILGRPAQAVSEILNNKKEITASTAVAIGEALGTSAELWVNLQASYKLAEARRFTARPSPVARRARLRSLVPLREVQKLGWVTDSDDLDEVEDSVRSLLGLESLDAAPVFAAAARRSSVGDFSVQQVAWIARVHQLGSLRSVAPYDAAAVELLAADLAQRVRSPYELIEVAGWLADVGVALVIVEPLKGSKIDGAVLFSEAGVPIVGLSTRNDRMDGFIFSLLHELAHLILGHVRPGDVRVDEDLDAEPGDADGSDDEIAADRRAGEWAFSEPLSWSAGKPKSAEIMAVARAVGVHPSLVVGRLQHDGVLGHGDMRRQIPKVRPFLPFDGAS